MRKSVAVTGILTLLTTLYPIDGLPSPIDLADSSKTTDSTSERNAPLALIVNGVTKKDYTIVILRAHDVLVRESDLIAAQVPLLGAVFVDINGIRYVSSASLAPHVAYNVDVTALALNLNIIPSLLKHQTLDMAEPSHYKDLAKADPSGFLTYSLTSSTENLGGQVNGFVQAGAGSAGTGLFTATASYANGSSHRGLVSYQKSSEQNLSQITIGDEYASTGNLGGNIVVGGFGATRHFELQPNYAYFATPGLRGTVLSPTTADIYVNGTLLRSVELAPGPFDLSSIPVPPGAGVTQVLLHDAYGNTQTLDGIYYEARQVLKKGLTDYDYHVGFLRQTPYGTHDVYGPFAALGSYRIGLSNNLTVGARFEHTAGLQSGGPQLDVGLPIGYISLV